MRKYMKTIVCALLACVLAVGAFYIYADQEYSSADDPLISLSYVNEVLLPQVKELIMRYAGGEDIGDVVVTTEPEDTEPEDTTPEVTEPEPDIEPDFPEGTISTGARFAVVQMQAGQTLYASVNSCEVIVRSGAAGVVSPFTVRFEEQGLSDTTDGRELYNEEVVPNNHMILIPRDDGRGIVVGEGGAWLMVRGDYRIATPEELFEGGAETTDDTADTGISEDTDAPDNTEESSDAEE